MEITPSHPTDDDLLAPPDLGDGIESLDYWRRRAAVLPWYQIGARREATLMILRWEERVSAAVLSQRNAPMTTRFAGGLLVARTRLRRWTVRAAVVVTVSIVIVMVAFVALVALVLSAL